MAERSTFKGIVYRDRVNPLTISIVSYDPSTPVETPVNFSAVDRMVLLVIKIDAETGVKTIVATADTGIDAALIDYSTVGEVTIKLGSLLDVDAAAIPIDDYAFRLTAYSAGEATQLIHEDSHIASLKWVNTDGVA